MQFSSRLPIATHILFVTYFYGDEQKITSEFLSASVGVNPVIIRKILGQLKSAGLINVAAGVGGTSLKKKLDEISLLDVFHAVESDEEMFHFHENPNPNCNVGKNIHSVLSSELDEVKKNFESSLKSVTLDKLVKKFKF